MTEKDVVSTKVTLMREAARLFAVNGYHKVTMRQIAAAVGINVATIYHHFASKEELLSSLFSVYTEERRRVAPDIDELLALVESLPAHEVLMRSIFYFEEPETREFFDDILVTATHLISADPSSELFIRENVFGPTLEILKPLLDEMVKRERIEPLDVDTFVSIFTYYGFAAASLNSSTFGQTPEQYMKDADFLFSFIVPKAPAE